ncbi:HNH endonuclease [Antricoccus suffuscus]|uniref:HNH endonuclease n=1 Tax=Antricoccus suffuscus TaxID=1629062 RepID=A0A2T1A0F0_9ACTN|nr:HNH endonuclease signature motif containing protein [Antricoccus suffuscus]PRZ41808.1 HNH endonuclease [Antricoccus suffuscus]
MSVAYLPAPDRLATVQHAFTEAARELIDTADRASLSGLGPAGLMQFATDLEQARNALAAVDHAVIGALEDTRAAQVASKRTIAILLADALHLTPTDARHRVEAAASLGARVTFTGQPQPPLWEYLAARQRAGRLTPAQARVITTCLNHLAHRPDVSDADRGEAETILTSHATTLGPKDLARLAAEIIDRLDPDGDEPRDEQRARQRAVHFHDSGAVSGQVTAELLAKLRAVLDPLAAPRPADASGRDARTGGQRMHDALLAAVNRLLDTTSTGNGGNGGSNGSSGGGNGGDGSGGGNGSRNGGGAPSGRGGIRGTVITTIRLDDLKTGCGYATSTHGVPIPVRDLLAEAAHLRFLPAVLDSNGVILHLGHAVRLASDRQYAALVARDGGCSFPGCDVPPEWCQIHHVTPWRDGGPTDLDNLALACGYHHREYEDRGWESVMIGGLPHWRPPRGSTPTASPCCITASPSATDANDAGADQSTDTPTPRGATVSLQVAVVVAGSSRRSSVTAARAPRLAPIVLAEGP